jgi:hypothetical protein
MTRTLSKRGNRGRIETRPALHEGPLPAQRAGMLLAAGPLLCLVVACSAKSQPSADGGSGGEGYSVSTGGSANVGGVSSGGTSPEGGSTGAQTGGWPSGGSATGGQPPGGAATGDTATGGQSSGGVATGGTAVGGWPSGGAATGGRGVVTGGQSSGGTAGAATGGRSAATGGRGTATGGQPSGGAATGGRGGTATGGQPSGGSATGGAAGDPLTAPQTCTSGTFWQSGTGPTMRPGEACISCHSSSGGPRLAVAGTVYPTGHEPNDCNGAGNAGVVVVITDASGQEHELAVNQAGNFTLSGTLAFPYTARVVAGGASRAMGSSQSTGDCNSCHTQSGSNGAPGRIVLPP